MTKPASPTARSYLFAPGNHPRKVEKVFGVGADTVILDLEDAVANAEKEATRSVVVEAMKPDRPCKKYVRVNGLGTPWCAGDIEAVVGPWVDGIVIPKAETAADLKELDAMITQREKALGMVAGSIDLLAIIETAKGVENAGEIAASTPRLRRLAFGGADYTLDLDYLWTADEEVLQYARARISHASRVAAIEPPVDTVVLQIRDHARFRDSAERGRKFGFSGKLCIHPSQVPICNAVYTPSPEDLAHAQAVIEAFEKAEAEGSASIQLDGYFIDYPMVHKARRIVTLMAQLTESSRGEDDS